MEPRLVERRRAVRQAAYRRKVRVFVVFGIVAAVVAAGGGATMSPLLDVDRITVVGSHHVAESDLVAASGIAHGDRLIDLDTNAARRSIMALPSIASARVVRDWPDAARITVTEERPVASVVSGDTVLLVSTTGRVLERRADADPSRPRMDLEEPLDLAAGSGRSGSDPVGATVPEPVRNALAVFERMSADLVPELSHATYSADGTLTFELPDGAEVEFGPPDDVAAKLLAVQSVLSQVVRDCMATVDVREPSRPSVSRGPGCPGISPAGSSTAASTSSTPRAG